MELGKSLQLSKSETGLYDLTGRKLSIKGEENQLNLSVIELFFSCKTPGPCEAEKFIKQQSSELSKLQYLILTKSVQKFMSENSITAVDSCTILSALDPIVMYRTDYIVCTK